MRDGPQAISAPHSSSLGASVIPRTRGNRVFSPTWLSTSDRWHRIGESVARRSDWRDVIPRPYTWPRRWPPRPPLPIRPLWEGSEPPCGTSITSWCTRPAPFVDTGWKSSSSTPGLRSGDGAPVAVSASGWLSRTGAYRGRWRERRMHCNRWQTQLGRRSDELSTGSPSTAPGAVPTAV